MSNEIMIPTAQSSAWLLLAQQKNQLFEQLAQDELALQKILIGLHDDYGVIDQATAAYRAAYTAMQQKRMAFTNIITAKIITPAMEFEKRADPKTNEAYIAATGKSLELRNEISQKAATVNAKNLEVTRFKNHVHDEYSRALAAYKGMIRGEFNKFYADSLNGGVKKPDIEKAQIFLGEFRPTPPAKFTPQYLTTAEMADIYATCQKPDYGAVFNELMQEMDTLFANYASDLANAAAAIQHQKEQAGLLAIAEQQKASEEQALNTLITTAETVQIDEPKIKRTLTVVMVESEGWAKAVMTNFMLNLPHLTKYMGRMKSWGNLSIAQMANYLGQLATETGDTVKGLEYKENSK